VDRRLAEIIERCLAVAPGDRLPNAQAVRDEMDARDRQRSRRPLLMLGVVAPVLLMAAMVPIFVNALTRNLHVTRNSRSPTGHWKATLYLRDCRRRVWKMNSMIALMSWRTFSPILACRHRSS
jgi:hypothetical protein